MEKNRVAIIVAGGQGKRMKASTPKQYLKIGDKPLLFHTLMAFNISLIDKIILVVPKNDILFCKEKIIPKKIKKKLFFTEGGKNRQESVFNGLLKIKEIFLKKILNNTTVLIHDGVRPFVLEEEIKICVMEAEKTGAAILASPIFETIKKIKKTNKKTFFIEKTVERENLYCAKTPQVFKFDLIEKSYNLAKEKKIIGTDDASLLELINHKVKIIPSNFFNVKITTKDDLNFAKFYLNKLK